MPGWKVWSELRRRTHIELVWAHLRGHRGRIEDLGAGLRRITIDASLDRRTRRAVLAHELVHDERGILFTDDTPVALIRKEESFVTSEATSRLVPLDELEERVRIAMRSGLCVEVNDVVEWFDVPRDTAERAMLMLQNRARQRHPTAHRS